MRKNKSYFEILLLIIPLAFYVFFWMFDGVVWCADTNSYVEMHSCREPLYPTFLAFFRLIFSDYRVIREDMQLYLFVAVGVQSIFAALVDYIVTKYLRETLNLPNVVSLCVLFMPMAASLLCRFAASRGSMYTNSILTESLAISMYLLFFRFCLEYVLTASKKSLICSLLVSILGINLRKQLYVLLCILILSVLYVEISRNIKNRENNRKKLLVAISKAVLVFIIVYGVSSLVDLSYNRIVNNTWRKHTEDNRFLTTMAFYTAERGLVEYVDLDLQDIFLDIYDICEENKWLMHDAPSGVYDLTTHFADNYDHIQLDTMELYLEDIVKERNFDYLGQGNKMDLIRASLNKSLLPREGKNLIKIFMANMVMGLVTTVSQNRLIFYIYSLIVYLIFIVLMVNIMHILRHNTKLTNERKNQAFAVIALSLLTLLGIFGNVALVSSVIFCQARYTIYNLPLFYIAIICLIYMKYKTKYDN